MPRAPRKQVAVLVDAASVGNNDLPDAESGGIDVDAFFTDLGGSSLSVQVHRRCENGPNAGRLAYVTKRPYTPTLLEDIQRDFGGGTYQLRALDSNTGKFVSNGTRTIVIDGPVVVPGSAPSSASAASNVANDRMDRLERMVERMVEGRQQASPLDDALKLAEVIKAFVPPADTKNNDRALDMYLQGRKEGIEEAKRFAAMTSGVDDSEGKALLQIGQPLIEMARERMAMDKAAVGAGVQIPQQQTAPQVSEEHLVPWWYRFLKPHVKGLYERAKVGKNPEIYADVMFEDLPDAYLPQLAGVIEDPGFMAQFLSVFPEFNESVALQQWIAAFVQQLRVCVHEATDPIDDAGQTEQAAS